MDVNEASRQTVEMARELVEVGRATVEADERHRRLLLLRDIGSLVEAVRVQAHLADAFTGSQRPTWQCAEQEALG